MAMDTNTPNTSTYMEPNAVAGNGLAAVGTVSADDRMTNPAVSASADYNPPQRRRFPMSALLGAAFVLFLTLGGAVAFYLARQNQNIQNQASSYYCEVAVDGSDCGGEFEGSNCTRGTVAGICHRSTAAGIPGCSCNPMDGGGSGGGGTDEPETPEEPGDEGPDDTSICGEQGQPCCASGNGAPVCGNDLFCNASSICDPSDDNLCRDDAATGNGGGDFNGQCALHACGSACNFNDGTECRVNNPTIGDCDELAAQLASTCGQVDYLQGDLSNPLYCGVKAIKCDGSCKGTGGGGGVTPPMCREIVAKVGLPGQDGETRAPKVGEQMFLKCKRVENGVKYKFRYFYTRKKGAAATEHIAKKNSVKVKAEAPGSNRSDVFTIERAGFYYAQCSACIPNPNSPNGLLFQSRPSPIVE